MDQVHVKRTLSLGKYRGLQRASTPEGYFTILAMDHHDILRRALNPSAPETVTDEQMAAFKGQVVHAFAPETSGVLLDPVYGAAQAVSGAYLNGAGLLVEMEKTGYKLKPLPLECELLPGWSVAKIKRMGADGVKLFFYYNPDGGALVAKHDTLLRQIVADCAVHDIPLYAEPIICAIGEDDVTYTQKFSQRVIDSARRVAALGADVLKLEFPLPPEVLDDELLCHDWCAQLTAELDIPWVLLSAGVSFETFCRQVEIACSAGASGYIGGRALWDEAARIGDEAERIAWLQSTGRERLRRLADAAANGRRWTDLLGCEPVSTHWYQTYEES